MKRPGGFDAAAAAYRPYHHRGAVRCGLAAAEALRHAGAGEEVDRRLVELERDAADAGPAPGAGRDRPAAPGPPGPPGRGPVPRRTAG